MDGPGRYSFIRPRMRPKMKMTAEELAALLKEDEAANADAAAVASERPEEIEEPPPTVPRPELVKAWVEVMNFYPEGGVRRTNRR
jgi:hypothetical protein